MKAMLAAGLIVATLTSGASASSGTKTVKQMLKGCEYISKLERDGKSTDYDVEGISDGNYCLAVFGTIDLLESQLPPKLTACVPPSVMLIQQIRMLIVDAQMIGNSIDDLPGPLAAVQTLHLHWPCKAE